MRRGNVHFISPSLKYLLWSPHLSESHPFDFVIIFFLFRHKNFPDLLVNLKTTCWLFDIWNIELIINNLFKQIRSIHLKQFTSQLENEGKPNWLWYKQMNYQTRWSNSLVDFCYIIVFLHYLQGLTRVTLIWIHNEW